MTQNTPIYNPPRAGAKHTWVFQNKTGKTINDLWIKTGTGDPTAALDNAERPANLPSITKVELAKFVDGEAEKLVNTKVERQELVHVFGPSDSLLRTHSLLKEEDKDDFIAYLMASREEDAIKKVLDSIGAHLWTLWEWIGEYTRSQGFGIEIKPDETFEITVHLDDEFSKGQWIEFIPVDWSGATISSSNLPDERLENQPAVVVIRDIEPPRKKKKKKRKKKKKPLREVEVRKKSKKKTKRKKGKDK